MPRDISRAPRPRRMSLPVTFLARVFVLASVAIVGSVWALVRFYTRPHAPMVAEVPVDAAGTPDWDAGPGLLPAPDLVVLPP